MRDFSHFARDTDVGKICVKMQKAPAQNARALSNESTLDGTGNLAGAEAPSTYVDMAGSTVDQSLNRRTFGFQVLLERLWEWETLIPKVTPLPQISHFAIFPAPPYLKGIE